MYSKKLCYLYMAVLFFSTALSNSTLAQCSTCTNTYTVLNGATDTLSTSTIPSTGNSYCLNVNGTLFIDDSWNANNICIQLAAAGRIIIEGGNHLCNLTNVSIRPLYNNMIEPFTVNAGSTLQVAYGTMEDVLVGFRGQGNVWLYSLDIDGYGAQGVGVVGPSSGDVTVDNCTFDNMLAGLTLQGAQYVSISDNSFTNMDLHGISATAVINGLSATGNVFDNMTKAMSFGSSSSSHFINNNTTSNVDVGLHSHTLGNTYIENNDFDFTIRGADLRYIENLYAAGNTFGSTQSSFAGMSVIGLFVMESSGTIRNNVFDDMDIGVRFRKKNTFDDNFTANKFNGNQSYGLYVDQNGRLGPQCHQGNEWNGSYSLGYGAFTPDYNVKYNSNFTVYNNNPALMPQHSPSGWFKYSTVPCMEDSNPGLPGLPGGGDGLNDEGGESSFARGSNSSNKVKVYPNPVVDNLNILLPPFSKNVKVELLDLTGKIIRRAKINDDVTSFSFDLFNNNSGIYIINVQSDTYKFSEKLIISN